jgi:hypothetical protein
MSTSEKCSACDGVGVQEYGVLETETCAHCGGLGAIESNEPRVTLDSGSVLRSGEYAKSSDGTWYAVTPNGLLANLLKHQVTEHEDGTITVTPSILVSQGTVGSWHGFLNRGIWSECR